MWKWIGGNKLLAVISAVLLLVVIASVADGITMRQLASRYLERAREWAAAYQRDTAASKRGYEGKIKQLTADRDAYRKKYEAAKGKMGAPLAPPKGAKELEERFRALGFDGSVR